MLTPKQLKDAPNGVLESILKLLDARGNVLNQQLEFARDELEDIIEEAQKIRNELKRRSP